MTIADLFPLPAAFLPCLAAAALASLGLAALLRWRTRLPVAVVDARTLHDGAIPRVGGLALWLGFVPIALLAPTPDWMRPMLWGGPWLLLAAVSLRDDVRSVGVPTRLAVHLAASGWFAWSLGSAFALPGWAIACTFVATAWAVNLYNFMDGSDGLAVTMAVVGFGAFGVVTIARGQDGDLPLALAAAALPLLFVNRPPARMFIGDVGAVPLGFLAAALGTAGVAAQVWEAWFPVLVFLPFVADATATLARRVLRGERFWESHKSHYYQRVHRLGAGHGGTLAAYGTLMVACAGTAVACATLAPQWGPLALAAWCVVHGVTFAAIDYHWRRSAPTT